VNSSFSNLCCGKFAFWICCGKFAFWINFVLMLHSLLVSFQVLDAFKRRVTSFTVMASGLSFAGTELCSWK
jgi:hypothetical protein